MVVPSLARREEAAGEEKARPEVVLEEEDGDLQGLIANEGVDPACAPRSGRARSLRHPTHAMARRRAHCRDRTRHRVGGRAGRQRCRQCSCAAGSASRHRARRSSRSAGLRPRCELGVYAAAWARTPVGIEADRAEHDPAEDSEQDEDGDEDGDRYSDPYRPHSAGAHDAGDRVQTHRLANRH